MSGESGSRRTGEDLIVCTDDDKDGNDTTGDDSSIHPASAGSVMAGTTRSVAYVLKRSGIPIRAIGSAFRKRAFLLIGSRTSTKPEDRRSNGSSKSTSLRPPEASTGINAPKAAGVTLSKTTTLPTAILKVKAAEFVKSGIAGVAVFGVYDEFISFCKEKNRFAGRRSTDDAFHENLTNRSDFGDAPSNCSSLVDEWQGLGDMAQRYDEHPSINDNRTQVLMEASVFTARHNPTGLSAHFAAGAMAGLVHSVFLDLWEAGGYWLHHINDRRKQLQQNGESTQPAKRTGGTNMNYRLIFRRAVHHSVGYATLFGCYETVRRWSVDAVVDYFASGSESVPHVLDALLASKASSVDPVTGVYDMTVIPMGTAFVAGGVAGQAQFVASHYTKHWKLQAVMMKHKHERPGHHAGRGARGFIPKAPNIRSVASSFLPTALCFLAFQYGAELTERALPDTHIDQEHHRRMFPVYVSETRMIHFRRRPST